MVVHTSSWNSSCVYRRGKLWLLLLSFSPFARTRNRFVQICSQIYQIYGRKYVESLISILHSLYIVEKRWKFEMESMYFLHTHTSSAVFCTALDMRTCVSQYEYIKWSNVEMDCDFIGVLYWKISTCDDWFDYYNHLNLAMIRHEFQFWPKFEPCSL